MRKAHQWSLAFILFGIAVLSDLLDGNIARFCSQKTMLGAALDPLADKFLILACFFSLAFVQSPLFSIPQWFVWIVLFKELILIFGVSFLCYYMGLFELRPTILGKLTTVVQFGFIGWLFACYFFGWVPQKTYFFMLGIVLVLVVLSLAQYLRIGLRFLKNN